LGKVCPLCKRDYASDVKVCPLAHCPNCGSTDIELRENILNVRYVIYLFLGGLSVILFALFFSPDLVIDTIKNVILALLLGVALAWWDSQCRCNTCGARFRSPIRNVPLRLEETISDMIRSEIEKIMDFMKELGS
jgi:hypothetical protein